MASKPKEPSEPKRLNRTVGLGEALSGVLDAALKKRGFASRDILTQWASMAPKPYDVLAFPDRLGWPRGARGAEGATLYLRCAPGQALALSHEGPRIAAAVNRYFGYLLVNDVRLSLEPMPRLAVDAPKAPVQVSAEMLEKASSIKDQGVREALERLGSALKRRSS